MPIRRISAALAAAALAGGCATHVSRLADYGPDAYAISCDDTAACERRADRLCPDGWRRIGVGPVVRVFTWASSPSTLARATVGGSAEAQKTLYMRCDDGAVTDPPPGD